PGKGRASIGVLGPGLPGALGPARSAGGPATGPELLGSGRPTARVPQAMPSGEPQTGPKLCVDEGDEREADAPWLPGLDGQGPFPVELTGVARPPLITIVPFTATGGREAQNLRGIEVRSEDAATKQ